MGEKLLPLAGHLEELRNRILWVLGPFLFFFGLSFFFIEKLLRILKHPAGDELGTLAVFSPTAAILCFIKIAFFTGLFFSLPVLLYQTWMFVRPAVMERTARRGVFFITIGTALFILGVLFSYEVLIPAALSFLLGIGKNELQMLISLDSYVSFVLFFLLGGGLVFEMPVVVFMLSRFGVLTADKMIRGWRVAIVGILITAAVLTPTPDVVNMVFLAIPMLALYLVSILVSTWAVREKKMRIARGD